MSDYAGPILTAVGYIVGSYFYMPQLGAAIGALVGPCDGASVSPIQSDHDREPA